MSTQPQIHYLPTTSDFRNIWVEGDSITVEGQLPEDGGKAITAEELEMIRTIQLSEGWTEFGISQRGGYAWTKKGTRGHIQLQSLGFGGPK